MSAIIRSSHCSMHRKDVDSDNDDVIFSNN